MPLYRIEQYGVYYTVNFVSAETEAEAVVKLYDGDCQDTGDLFFLEVAEDFGVPVDENQELAEELRDKFKINCEDVIPSIRSITTVE